MRNVRISFAFSNCNRLVSEVTFALCSGGGDNESGLTLDCSFRFSTKRERGEREGRQTNSLKGQILAVGERSQHFPICSYFRLRQLHIIFNFYDCLPYFPGSRFNPLLVGDSYIPFFVRWPGNSTYFDQTVSRDVLQDRAKALFGKVQQSQRAHHTITVHRIGKQRHRNKNEILSIESQSLSHSGDLLTSYSLNLCTSVFWKMIKLQKTTTKTIIGFL